MYGGKTLTELIAGVEAHRKTLTVFNVEANKTLRSASTSATAIWT